MWSAYHPRWHEIESHCTAVVGFFFNDTATTEIYTLSLHDALPISAGSHGMTRAGWKIDAPPAAATPRDRKSTRLNSSHGYNSYAVFCLKKNIMIQAIANHKLIGDDEAGVVGFDVGDSSRHLVKQHSHAKMFWLTFLEEPQQIFQGQTGV